jgi:hypothetical protein
MRLIGIGLVMVALNAAALESVAAGSFETPPALASQIDVTSDSPSGWVPTAEQRDRALATVRSFLDAVEAGRYEEAYGLLGAPNREQQTAAQFVQDQEKFRTAAGPLKYWRVLKVTWTKDPPRGPFSGVFAAIDLAGQFANVDRDCGYIVVYQSPGRSEFTVMRRENNYLDNSTAQKIAAQKSKAEVESIWRQMSRYCPNYQSPPP